MRLFLEAERTTIRVELDHAVSFGILHRVGEHGGAAVGLRGGAKNVLQPRAIEDVVAERERDLVAADERLSDEKGLRQPPGRRLRGIGEADAEVLTRCRAGAGIAARLQAW